ncbi:DUF1630-domain-containing protein [Panus rudis PR-1116 ss-1]|nr:DUF1630-domain-containing protein [Panus rudis PR-1116 ss-1]
MNTPPRRPSTRRPSTIKIRRPSGSQAFDSPLKSPSSPDLLKELTVSVSNTPRRLSRSKTLPRIVQNDSVDVTLDALSLQDLAMSREKITKLRRWIHALVVVDFDLEYGPKITKVYPHLALGPSESENIAFSSFPDAPQTAEGSHIHSFRLRLSGPSEDILPRSEDDRPSTHDGYMYGFSYFTQRRDSTSKRGYQQRSLVVLTQHAYPALFYTILTHLGNEFLLHGGPMLEAACHNIAHWSDPEPGSVLELGFLGSVFTTQLPSSVDTPQSQNTVISIREYDADNQIFASLPPPHPPILNSLEACLPHLWSIWECLVLCEPILIYGPSAAMTSQVVWWLRDILRPIPLTGDFRPFFTIHDVDYGVIVNPRPPQSGVLLGVTNPLIEKACKHWPHVISLGSSRLSSPKTARTPRTPWSAVDTWVNFNAGPAPGWKSKTHKRYISRDRALLKKCEEAINQGGEQIEASMALRQHFSQRTTAFLVPLQRYLNTLIPTPAESATAAHFPSLPSAMSMPSSVTSISGAPSPLSLTSASSSSSLSSAANSPTIPAPQTHLSAPTPTTASTLTAAPSTPTLTPAATPSFNHHLRLKPFSAKAFIASLSPYSSSLAPPSLLPFKSNSRQKEFYDRWIRSRAFGVWLSEQEEIVKNVLEKRGN